MRIVGYGVCGPNEKYLEDTLKEFKRLCDDVVIVGNNIDNDSSSLIKSYGFKLVIDNREWGKSQNRIKEDLVKNHVAGLNPDWCVCLDMDETFDSHFTRERLEELESLSDALHFYVTNLWDDGWNPKWSFWNIRAWKWKKDMQESIGDKFYAFEQRPLHCGLAPKWAYMIGGYAPHLLIHRGLQDKKTRDRKVDRYKKYDPNAQYRDRSYYDALAKDESVEYNEEEVYKQVKEEVSNYKQKPKPLHMKPKEPIMFFRRVSDGVVLDTPASRAGSMLNSPDFELVHEAVTPDKKAPLIKKDSKKKVVYVANHGELIDDDTEGHIARSFRELGYDVQCVEPDENIPDGDLLLYHKWIPDVSFSGKKACWMFDKVDFNDRRVEMQKIKEMSDFFFTSDMTAFPDAIELRQGVGYECDTGEKVDCPEIVFTGSGYNGREDWISLIKQEFGDKFGHYNRVFRKELNDLMVSSKIVVCPDYPVDENYWSNRAINAIGRGAFVIHPDCGIRRFLEPGKEIVLYKDREDMIKKIKYYLSQNKRREAIREAGVKKVRENYTYKDSVKEIVKHVFGV